MVPTIHNTKKTKKQYKPSDIAIAFIENTMYHYIGKHAGQPFKLLPFQKSFIRSILDPMGEDGYRKVREAFMQIARKCGKSYLVAALAIYFLVLDGESSPNIYIAASTRDQAGTLLKYVKGIIRSSPILKPHFLVRKNDIYYPPNDGTLVCLSRDANTAHSLNVHVALCDELHVWPTDDLYTTLQGGMGARMQPLMIGITTAGMRKSGLAWDLRKRTKDIESGKKKDPTFYGKVYEVPEDADWKDSSLYHLANPALGQTIQLKDLEAERDAALSSQTKQAAFRVFKLGQYGANSIKWIRESAWQECADTFGQQDFYGWDAYVSLDMSRTIDMTAISVAIKREENWHIIPYYFVPEDGIEDREERDKVPYRQWAEEGLVQLVPGASVEPGVMFDKLAELKNLYNILITSYDPWGVEEWFVKKMETAGLNPLRFSQADGSMSKAIKMMERLCLNKQLRHNNHRVLNWNLQCAYVKMDSKENLRFDKVASLKSSGRIDGLLAATMAVFTGHLEPENNEILIGGV